MTERAPKTRVCLVASYRDPNYVRVRNLRAALLANDDVELIDATNEKRGLGRYLETIVKTIRARWQHRPDCYLLGFRGHEIFWIIRLITLGKPLIFDAFMSPSDALISEGKLGWPGRIAGALVFPLEWLCLRLSQRCTTDTECHRNFFAERFGIRKHRIDVVYVGASELEQIPPPVATDDGQLEVLFYGTFLPLHGVDVILQACRAVRDLPIHFRIIGGSGEALENFRHSCRMLELDNVSHDTWVDFDELQQRIIPRADLCLGGPFGGTPQARRVITGKTMQFLAQGKATVIGRTDEPAGFVDRDNCLLVEQADADALATAFRWAHRHRVELPGIAARGRELFQREFSLSALTRQLAASLDALR